MKIMVPSTLVYHLSALTLVILSVFQPLSAATPIQLNTIDNINELEEKEGYALIYVDAAGVAPSFQFIQLNSFLSVLDGTRIINLKSVKPGLYIFKLPEGNYQINRVNAPFFDLPFQLNTARSDNWRFTINKEKVNYIGHLVIKKERATNFIDVNLFNRIANDYNAIHENYSELLGRWNLVSGMKLRDDFLDELPK